MVMRLDQVVPFGRSLSEYQQLFNLTPTDLRKRIFGVGDGPASFNAEATALGANVTSIDPIYAFTGDEIRQRFEQVVDNIMDQIKATPGDWVWGYHQSPEELRRNREVALHRFLADYPIGLTVGRYQVDKLPELKFEDNAFDLALCSHFLFLYSEQVDYEFHRASVYEMLRVSPEVRVFPLLTLMLERSPHLDPLLADLNQAGYQTRIERVPYELQRGGNEMLVVQRPIVNSTKP
jgi:hypothetical protein